MFENMPHLSDEAVWDLLELLVGLLDAYENHYAVELQRLRAQRHHEIIREHERRQLLLALNEFDEEPF
jgi:hypothetical protein